MNLLTDIIPASARKYLYALYSLSIIVVGALSVADASTGKAPDVLAYVGGALGLVAASNVPDNGEEVPDDVDLDDPDLES